MTSLTLPGQERPGAGSSNTGSDWLRPTALDINPAAARSRPGCRNASQTAWPNHGSGRSDVCARRALPACCALCPRRTTGRAPSNRSVMRTDRWGWIPQGEHDAFSPDTQGHQSSSSRCRHHDGSPPRMRVCGCSRRPLPSAIKGAICIYSPATRQVWWWWVLRC